MKTYETIPMMDRHDILRYSHAIRPIVRKFNIPYYLRKLTPSEIFDTSYCWLIEDEDYCERVEIFDLYNVADVKMIHPYECFSFFIPTFADVIRQIPKHLIDYVDSFEVIYKPLSFYDLKIFREEFDAGYHVSIVRLYSNKEFKSPYRLPIGTNDELIKKISFPILPDNLR